MKPLSLVAALALLLAGCTAAAPPRDHDALVKRVEQAIARDSTPGASAEAELDKTLSGSIGIDLLVRLALERNLELREGVARTRAAMEEIRRAGGLPDPMFKFEIMGVPLNQPLALTRNDSNKFGFSQTLPGPGILDLRSEQALHEAEAAFEQVHERERGVVAEVKKAAFEYATLTRELGVVREQVRLLQDFEKISDIRFRNGTAPQQDVLKPQVEQVLLHEEIVGLEQRIASARAAVNFVLARSPSAPLGPPNDADLADIPFDLAELQRRAATEHPAVLAGERRLAAARTALRLAEREAKTPEIGIGFDYWQVPTDRDAWGAMLTLTLPWWNTRHAAETRKMKEMARAEEIALEQVRNRIRFEVQNAVYEVESARKSLLLLNGELLPKSRQGVEISRAAYQQNKASFLELFDAERTERDVCLRAVEAAGRLAAALAELERAAGIDLRVK